LDIATEKETEELLAKYMDLSILPKEILPGKGKGSAEVGYEPIWEGGTLPPPAKDDWQRGTPVFGASNTNKNNTSDDGNDPTASSTINSHDKENNHASQQQQQRMVSPVSKASILAISEDTPAPQTPIQPTTSATSFSTISSSSEWESLSKRTPAQRANIQQVWTVTPETDFDLKEAWSKENFDAMAKLWNLTNVEQIYMEELQERIADIQHWKNDPYEVVRYYKEFKGNLDTVEHMFREMVAWRVENNMDEYLSEYGQPDPLFHYIPLFLLRGTDRDGDPIHVDRMGACDYYSLLKHFGSNAMVEFFKFTFEYNTSPKVWSKYEQDKEHRVKKCTIIIDLDGLGMHHLRPGLLPLLNRVSRISQGEKEGT